MTKKFRFKRGDKDNDLRRATFNELSNKFQLCHDEIWEGGKRDPAVAFDEISKLLIIKLYDEGIPLLRIMNLKQNKLDLQDVVKLPKTMKKDLGNAFVNEGDLLISRSGTVGVVSVVPKEA